MSVEATTLYPVWTNFLFPNNFMLQDVLGSLVALLAFTAVLYAPGYLVGYATDLFEFRKMDFVERSLWAMACSFAVVPIAAYLVGRIAGLTGICWLLVIASVATLLLLWRKRSSTGWSRSDCWITALLVSGWTLFVLLMLVDAQVGHKLYFSVVMADQSYRIAFTDAVARTGVPPNNPLYFAGSPAPMHYYYFWYVLCASVVKIAGVSARQSFIASSIWSGFGLLAVVKLYASHFFRWERKQRWIALGLLVVTGVDLIPSVGNAILQPALNGDIEWWSVDPIDAWPDSLLWVPHHVASVLCCLLCFLFLWRTLEPLSRSSKRWPVVLAAIAFASAFGLSVYVAFGFALLMSAWLVRLAITRQPERYKLWSRIAISSVLSALLLTPFVRELVGGLAHPAAGKAAANNAPAAHLFSLSIRRMIDSGLLTGLPVFSRWNQTHPVLLDQTIRFFLLLPGLAMELGIYGAILVFLLLAKHRQEPTLQHDANDARSTAFFFTVCGLVMTMFLSSAVITNNDFGYRAVMLPQFFLLLLTADVLGSWWISGSKPIVPITPARRRLVYSLLSLGIASSLFGAVLLRTWLPLETHRPQNGFSELPQDEFEVRDAFTKLNRFASKNAVVNFRGVDLTLDRKDDEVMTPSDYYQRMLVMDTGRQILNAEWKCAIQFGGNPSACTEIQTATEKLYASPSPSAAYAQTYCSRFGVQYLLIGHRDPAWTGNTGWPATLPVIEQESGLKILKCS